MFSITKSIVPLKEFPPILIMLLKQLAMMILVFLESDIKISYSPFVIKGGTNKEKDRALIEKYLTK